MFISRISPVKPLLLVQNTQADVLTQFRGGPEDWWTGWVCMNSVEGHRPPS